MPPFPLRFHFEKRQDRYYSHSFQFLLQLAATSFQHICFLITPISRCVPHTFTIFPIGSPNLPYVPYIFHICSIFRHVLPMDFPWKKTCPVVRCFLQGLLWMHRQQLGLQRVHLPRLSLLQGGNVEDLFHRPSSTSQQFAIENCHRNSGFTH